MALVLTAQPPPLATDADGVLRVGATRLTLDTVVGASRDGATAEEVVAQYPALALADVYAVFFYYLRQQPEVDAYLAQRAQLAQQVRQQNEQRTDPQGIRERLLRLCGE